MATVPSPSTGSTVDVGVPVNIVTDSAGIGGGSTVADTLVFDADADNTAQSISTTASSTLVSLHVINSNTTPAYVQLFDVAAGSVTVGTTTPDYVIVVPASDGTNPGATDLGAVNIQFATAITYACTTTATGNGDPTTGLILSAAYV